MTFPDDTVPASRTPRAAIILGVVGAVVVGVLVALQSRVNGQLGHSLGDGYLAAVISFGSGLVIMIAVMLVRRSGRTGLRLVVAEVRSGGIRWWYLLGGFLGGFFVLSQGLTSAMLGVALFTVAIVAGQTISGLVIDRRGIGTTAPAAITLTRLVGSVLALLAVCWAVSAQLVGNVPLWMLVLPFIAGLGQSLQQAVNGQVRVAARSAITATFLNFVAGTLILLVVWLISLLVTGWHFSFPSNPLLYTGGLIGTIFIAMNAVIVRTTGVLLLGLGSTAGQLVTSLLLDLFVPEAGDVVAWTTIAGTALTLVAVAITAVPSRPLRSKSGSLRA
jgi:transporter family-2 protein